MLAFNAEKGQHLVFYDDGEDEWVDLSLQHVAWHEHARGVTVAHGLPAGDPRSVIDALCTATQHRLLSHCHTSPHLSDIAHPQSWSLGPFERLESQTQLEDLLQEGLKTVMLCSHGAQVSNKGVVEAHKDVKDLDLAWLYCLVSMPVTSLHGLGCFGEQTGLVIAGTTIPKGKAAVGWRVAVYWRDDKAFYPAEIMGFDTATGRHEVEYDDGELPQPRLITAEIASLPC